jgi:1-pyrroline-5-carboxylate dehydrogenase
MSAIGNIPAPVNEPVLQYAPGSPERGALERQLSLLGGTPADIPVVVDGREHRTGDLYQRNAPHRHDQPLATVHRASPGLINDAIDGAVLAQRDWERWEFADRAAVFLKAADLLAGPWRQRVNAATMLGQSKTSHQAEIDAACELIDFLRFNVHYAERILHEQPGSSTHAWNRMDYRPLEGFVYAVTPFNFTSIGGNLPTAPAILGNVVLWKPSATASLSNWLFYELLLEAGLPPGVIQFVPGDARAITEAVLADARLTGIHFTGSTEVFRSLWHGIGSRLDQYRNYPRIVGETGGKDFVLAHPSADVEVLVTALIRGAFEYQGQKCSAASRCYIPRSLWPAVERRMREEMAQLRMGDPTDFSVFVGAVIDEKAWVRLDKVIAALKTDPRARIVAGGNTSRDGGWFIEPTLVELTDPRHQAMTVEFFGPILSAYVYDDKDWDEVLALVDSATPYALTGAVFAQDRAAVISASTALRHAAGNFYVNDKPTGAVVGQQPFGGARASGTNDKAGSILNLYRWVSPRSIKENGAPPRDWRYPYLDG